MGIASQSTTTVTVTYTCDICGATQEMTKQNLETVVDWCLKQEHAWQIVTYANPFVAKVTEYRCPKCHLTPGVAIPKCEVTE